MQRVFRGLAAQATAVARTIYRHARRRVGAARIRQVRRTVAKGYALANKVAVITGASRGIGLAIATAFARAGAHCILVDIDRGAGMVAVNDLAAQGINVELAIADVSDVAQVRKLALEISQRHARVDILVNNAGVQLDDDLRASTVDEAVVQRTLAVNLFGAMHACSAFAPFLPAGGRIINVSSTRGQLSQRSDGCTPAYRVSKAALNSYTQSLAADLAPRGVMVDSFHPGWVRTAIGGPNAKTAPEDATDTAFFLATRLPTEATGLFWYDCQTIKW